MQVNKKTGVLLLNMGGPSTLDEVEPFLFNLFSDREIIRLGPALLQKPLARFISRRRAPKSKENYQKIGGGSPLLHITTLQARALEKMLENDGNYLVRPCMRYWKPYAEKVLLELIDNKVRNIIALPLYPHYSKATTGSSFSDLKNTIDILHLDVSIHYIPSWPDQPFYIECLAGKMAESAALFGKDRFQVVYSAHSLPQKYINEGDPYVKEINKTIGALEAATGYQGVLCFQSRSGPVKWLKPSTPEMLNTLAEKGIKNILMVPISFVSDHIETLYEINMLYRNMAENLGIRLESSRGLNDDLIFIKALRQLVLNNQ